MKIRNGFISNSSSSSFIISEDKKQAKKVIQDFGSYDYYEFNGKLYTSFISDASALYSTLCNKFYIDYEYEGGHDGPYNDEDFYEVIGNIGRESVYIPKGSVTKEQLSLIGYDSDKFKDKLFNLTKEFVLNNYKILNENNLLSDELSQYLLSCKEIIKQVCDIEEEYEDED